jgi:hypothetical protein
VSHFDLIRLSSALSSCAIGNKPDEQSRRPALFRLLPLRLPLSFGHRGTCGPSPCGRLSRPRTTTTAPSPWASRPVGDPVSVRVERDSAT